MSGMIIGAKTRAFSAGFGGRRSRPRASSVPMMVEMSVAATATISVFLTEARMASLWTSSTYHWVVKPVHAVGKPLLLNDSTIRTTIGP